MTTLAAVVLAASMALPSPAPTATGSVSGVAPWYDYRAGEAAAGPALRRALRRAYGSWRGRTVAVIYRGERIRVRLTDWCRCRDNRIIDLDDRSFAKLAWLGRGVLSVTVRY